MKRLGKILTAVISVITTVVLCAVFAACGATTKFSTKLDAGLQDWDYCFVSVNAFGDDPGVGMLNIDNWGNKKLKLGTDGVCAGTGSVWTITLDVEDSSTYKLTLSSHITGDGVSYDKEGDFSYTFEGSYTKKDNSYVLAQPTYCKVELTGEFTRLTDGSDFADYIPSAPWSIDSNTSDDADSVKSTESGIKGKILPSKLCNTVFLGATFNVDGTSIVSVTDIK
ncbi:MAG: hypothetical protein ACI4MH_05455 [Candidatus Coproplasma sp.]